MNYRIRLRMICNSKHAFFAWLFILTIFYPRCNAQTTGISDCGRKPHSAPLKRTLLVVGGQKAETHWPWMAAIRVKTRTNTSHFVCGGSLITKRHILTAAHCFGPKPFARPLSDFQVILGSLTQNKIEPLNRTSPDKETIISIPSFLNIHDDFKYPGNKHDVAILTLRNEVVISDRIMPVCLPLHREQRRDYGPVTIIGWGGIIFGEKSSNVLQEATLKIIPINRCRQILRGLPKFSEEIVGSMICAADPNGEKDACQGDSGGPLLMEDEEEDKWFQIGLVTFGFRCAEKGYPGIYARVASYIPWIQKITKQRLM